MAPEFLTLAEVITLHQDQIARYGGTLGVRDSGLLESALAMPAATFGGQFLHADVYEMAAAYLFHLVQNHPFIDGNKRVGAASAAVFLVLNGQQFVAAEDDFAEMVLAVARGERGKSSIAEFLRTNCQPVR
jgi:death-on-curing protein